MRTTLLAAATFALVFTGCAKFGFYYEDMRKGAARNATHVRFTYKREGGTEQSRNVPLVLHKASWRPGVTEVVEVKVQPFRGTNEVGQEAKAIGQIRYIKAVCAFTSNAPKAVVNLRWWVPGELRPLPPGKDEIIGQPTDMGDLIYTDNTGGVKRVRWWYYRWDGANYVPSGNPAGYSKMWTGGGPLIFTFSHLGDPMKPSDVGRVVMKTYADTAGTMMLDTVTATASPVGTFWTTVSFETDFGFGGGPETSKVGCLP